MVIVQKVSKGVIPGNVLCKLFADTKDEVVAGMVIDGLPDGYVLAPGSTVSTADFNYGKIDSNGVWHWKENGGGGSATLITKSITANGTYNPADDEADGYSEVTVNVPATPTTYDVQGTFPIYDDGEVYSEMMASQSTNITEYAPFNMVINFPEEGSTIKNDTCHGWRGLHTVHIPNHYTDIGEGTFSECHDLVNANIPTSVTELKEDVFFYSGITSIDIPAGVTTIGPYAFAQCDYLKSVICRATTPPTISGDSFNEIPSDCIFYVPAASVDAYKAASNWSELYQEILPIPTT